LPSTLTSGNVVGADLDDIAGRLGDVFASLAGKRLLITGGAGFLGYYLVQSVVRWNEGVSAAERVDLTVYDNYARGVPGWLSGLARQCAVERYDIVEPLSDDSPGFEYVIHAAGIASPTFYRRYPIETMDANVVGLRNLLEYSRARQEAGRPLEGFLYFSSSEIYGDPSADAIPTPETYRGNVSCTGPRACYDESKRYGETLCVNFAREYGLPVAIVRPFNNYGPGLKITDRRVIPDFARDVLAGRDMVMFSGGYDTRTFCYVADAVVGYYQALVRGRPGEPYNIGADSPEISILELAERIADCGRDLFGYTGKVVRGRSPERDYLVDNPRRRCPVIEKARAELGFDPQVSLEEGLRRTLLWYRENDQ
jgi:UDP-glucuronate decarboxylase